LGAAKREKDFSAERDCNLTPNTKPTPEASFPKDDIADNDLEKF
jgi:hypothetical protein